MAESLDVGNFDLIMTGVAGVTRMLAPVGTPCRPSVPPTGACSSSSTCPTHRQFIIIIGAERGRPGQSRRYTTMTAANSTPSSKLPQILKNRDVQVTLGCSGKLPWIALIHN